MHKAYLIPLLMLAACGPKVEHEDVVDAASVTVTKGLVGQDTLPDWISIVTDQDTGCQYLASTSGALVKREGSGCPTKGPMVDEDSSDTGSEEPLGGEATS